MRILHVIPGMGPGGAEQVVADLAGWQAKQGHEVRVLLREAVDAWPGVPPEVRARCRPLSQWGVPARYREIATWLLRYRTDLARCDVIHVHLTFGSVFGAAVQVMQAVSGLPHPVVVETDHSAGMPLSRRQRAVFSVARLRRSALVSVVRGSLSTRQVRGMRVWEVPNGISPLRLRETWDAHRPFTIGSLGLLRTDRVPLRYLDLVEKLVAERDVQFVYGGDGPLQGTLRDEVQRRGLEDNVSLAGLVIDRAKFFSELDAHVSMAVGEDVGLATLEAASSGLPSVGIQMKSGYDGISDVFPSSSDYDELKSLLVGLADSEAARRSRGLTQAEFVREHRSVDSMGRAYEEVYWHARAGR